MNLVRRTLELIWGLLRELSDETAYKRYLAGRPASGEEWRRFSDRRHRAKYAKAKCC